MGYGERLLDAGAAPVLSVERVRRLDRHAIDGLGWPSVLLMEEAAAGVEEAVLELLAEARGGEAGECGRVLVLAGVGNNGGDGLAAARRLATRAGLRGERLSVRVGLLARKGKPTGDAAVMLRLAEAAGVEVRRWSGGEEGVGAWLEGLAGDGWVGGGGGGGGGAAGPMVVVDGLLGTGVSGGPRGSAAGAVRWLEAGSLAGRFAVLAVDVPTGLDADTGRVLDGGVGAVRATATVALAASKPGLAAEDAREWVGRLRVAPIGLPWSLYEGV